MKQIRRHPLAAAYVLALALWALWCAFGWAQSLYWAARGLGGAAEIGAKELRLNALKAVENEEGWLVSTDSDPQIYWASGGRYLENVTLLMETAWPAGSVSLYYRTQGQPAFTPAQILYATRVSDTEYRFDLGGVRAEEIRIDPASQGGVRLRLDGLRLEPAGAARFVPDGRQAALLLGAPPVALALWRLFCTLPVSIRRRQR